MDSVIEFLRSIWGLWLMLIFAGIVAWAYWPGRRKSFEAQSRIPLQDDEA